MEIPESWKNAKDEEISEITATDFVREIVFPMDRQQGDKLPVSVFKKHGVLDGTWENGTSAYAKKGCGQECSKVERRSMHPVQPLCSKLSPCSDSSCPVDRGGEKNAPETFAMIPAKRSRRSQQCVFLSYAGIPL